MKDLKKKYKAYREHFLRTHENKHGLRSLEGFKKHIESKSKHKKKAWDTYSLFACDFETTYEDKELKYTSNEILQENRETEGGAVEFKPSKYAQVFLAGCMNIKTGEYMLSYENIPDILNNISKMTYKENKRRAVAYFHNLSFDGDYLLKWLITHNYKQTLNKSEKTGEPKVKRGEFALLKSNGKIFKIVIFWYGIKIIFYDSLKILPEKLANLGELVGYKKLSELVDYKKFEIRPTHDYPEEWLTYLKRDCEILAKVLSEFFKHEPKAHSVKRFTIGAISYANIKKDVDDLTPIFTLDDFTYFNQWYSGGLCFPSLKYWAKWYYKPNTVKMVDAVSMYPSQMIKILPFGKPKKQPLKSWKKYVAFYKLRINKAILKSNYLDFACLPRNYAFIDGVKKYRTIYNGTVIKTPYQYVSHTEDWDYYLTDCELEALKSIYDIDYKVLEAYYFEASAYLANTVKMLFIEKQEASRHNDPVRKKIAKLKLNNLYGKLGQKPNRSMDFYGKPEDIPETYKILGKKRTIYEAYNIQEIKDETDKAQPVFISAYITALARCELIKKYKYITDNGGTFLYCDTDSICFADNPKKPIVFNDIGDELGCWSYECYKGTKTPFVADAFLSLCPKQYRVVKKGLAKPLKVASAGISPELIATVKNQDYNYELPENNNYKLVKRKLTESVYGKVIDENSPFNFKKWKKYFKKISCPEEIKNKNSDLSLEEFLKTL